MSRKNPKSNRSPKNSVETFRGLAETLATETPAFAEAFAEPWPDWMRNMAVRFTSIVAPQVIAAAKRGDDEFMLGQVVAAEMQMVDLLRESNVIQELRRINDPRWNFMVEQLAIVAICLQTWSLFR